MAKMEGIQFQSKHLISQDLEGPEALPPESAVTPGSPSTLSEVTIYGTLYAKLYVLCSTLYLY